METKCWKEIKDTVYGTKATARHDELEIDFEGFKIGLLIKKIPSYKGTLSTRRLCSTSTNYLLHLK